ncbi:MAG TPA: methylated-DNA--[protein]-cysteine S-methyltransferase [Dissulfurispiraceae bacterium]|nr:methylated-DNA--[protein]-cysteine S-methyltransferase [Dissulfurispiraceae bacterium]
MKKAQNDYELVEHAILFIEKNFRKQPSLKETARAVGLSEYHFQRLFKRWAGISPKRFLQFVTAAYARVLLKERRGLIDVAYDSGLSSASRLHDLFINIEAVTPGEIRGKGHHVIIRYGFHQSPFGECFIAITDKGICCFEFTGGNRDKAVASLTKQWQKAELIQDKKITKGFVDKIFAGTRQRGESPLHVKGTNFQIKVWEALLKVPQGAVVSYEELAALAGKPKAVRAVANAVAHNPVAFLIPCHRVIRKTGGIGGYHWGSTKKTAILLWESGPH